MNMKYKNYELDKFQEDAINSVNKNHSVVVSAATGTGKTLIADYIIDKAVKEDKRVIYTAPIKALSNQKYKEFKAEYGDKVGILTGDVVINDKAPILIMTTEIYRNMLMEHSVDYDLSYVIFDEIHFMNDRERGTVWEESIIFSPNEVRFLCLSATIPNADIFAKWISNIKEHTVDVVIYMKRAVPLKHFPFTIDGEMGSYTQLKKIVQMEKDGDYFSGHHKGKNNFKRVEAPNQLDLVKHLESKDLLPCIFFSLSRKSVRDYALDCAKNFNFINDQDRFKVVDYYNQIIPKQIRAMNSIQDIRQIIVKGIGIHHAGLLPKAKELVEVLFEKGLIKVLYATETFAVGINMPTRSVALASMRKYDGMGFRSLYSKEYHQMAGRAGRRGLDSVGYAYAMIEKRINDIEDAENITRSDSEPIESQFKMSANTVLNLLDHYSESQIEVILKSNFGYFVRKHKSKRQVRIARSYINLVKSLKTYGYIDDNNVLTGKGRVASRLYANEMLITELLFEGTFTDLSEMEILVLLGSVVYEPRRADKFYPHKKYHPLKIPWKNPIISKELDYKNLEKVDSLVRLWTEGCTFDELTKACNMQEGDLIRFFRQIIDRLGQIMKAESMLTEKLKRCTKLIDRDVVAVEF